MRIGIIVLSWSYRPGREPNPCNVSLAGEYKRAYRELTAEGHSVFGSLQWEAALNMGVREYNVVKVVRAYRRGSTCEGDSQEILEQSLEAFDEIGGVDEIVVIANPWIHLLVFRAMAKKRGVKIRSRKVRWIGFDKESSQWQVRGPIRSIVYTILRVLHLYQVTTSLPRE